VKWEQQPGPLRNPSSDAASWKTTLQRARASPVGRDLEQGNRPNLVLPKAAAQVPLNLPLRRSA
jgi:hypothetical protein